MSSKVAALYIRVSTEDQTELSPDAQKRLLLDYAQKSEFLKLSRQSPRSRASTDFGSLLA